MMKLSLWIALGLLFLSQSLLAQFSEQIDPELKDLEVVQVDKEIHSEKKVCEFFKKNMSKTLGLTFYCTDDYIHICSSSSASTKYDPCLQSTRPSKRSLKIGGFNVFNMGKPSDMYGNYETGFKNYDILAHILNQFDITAAVELKHFDPKDHESNLSILEAYESEQQSISIANSNTAKKAIKRNEFKSYIKIPAYIAVLKKLQAKNPQAKWSLILSTHLNPKLTGFYNKRKNQLEFRNDIINYELSGHYYRARELSPKETSYCGDQVLACSVKEQDLQAHVARKPFLTTFKRGHNEFIYAGYHATFRSATWSKNLSSKFPKSHLKDKSKRPIKMTVYEEMLDVFNAATLKNYDYLPPKRSGYWVKPIFNARYAEIKIVMNFFGQLQEESNKAVLVFGDFNVSAFANKPKESKRLNDPNLLLEHLVWFDKKGALENWPGSSPFLNFKTSLGTTGLVSYYDHFVFKKSGVLKTCQVNGEDENKGRLDFTSKNEKEIQKLVNKAKSKEFISLLEKELKETVRVSKKSGKYSAKPQFSFQRKTPAKLSRGETMLDIYNNVVVNPDPKKKLNAYKAIISDHLPIFITCF